MARPCGADVVVAGGTRKHGQWGLVVHRLGIEPIPLKAGEHFSDMGHMLLWVVRILEFWLLYGWFEFGVGPALNTSSPSWG